MVYNDPVGIIVMMIGSGVIVMTGGELLASFYKHAYFPLVPGLTGGKMSSSEPVSCCLNKFTANKITISPFKESKIDVLDSAEDVQRKLKKVLDA